MSHPLSTNRLIHEKSPYLLQHAHNPIDWYPWGEEAFKTAKEQDKPIFLSIGYAACHWCHVMEKESFQSGEIAQLMNAAFINVKVDREEKPEVDGLYMEFAQAMMSGGAGWPLNLILTPDLLPFFAATYLPADSKHGFVGLKQLIARIEQLWKDAEERETVIMQAGKIVDVFKEHIHTAGNELPAYDLIKEAATLLFKTADPIYGGTKGAPKFPISFQACFLLHFTHRTSDSRALFYVERTLDMMHRGGIYDHLGGGFSRYSVDESWLSPHFEKMLYDNALISYGYLEAWHYTRNTFYREIGEEIIQYVLRELTYEEGGFYSAEDADTEGHEGRFYTWGWEEIVSALGEDASLFCDFYGVTHGGNFEGRTILHMTQALEEFSSHRRLDPVIVSTILKQCRQKLSAIREKRPHPKRDEKIISGWNGLMIYSCAEAGKTTGNTLYLDAAERAATFIRDHLWKEGTLLRRWCDGEARFEGCLDDYASMIHGLISLFEADRGTKWLEFALTLNQVLKSEFKEEKGAYYLTNGKDPNLILRRCEFYDGAEPSGNAIQAENLLRLYQITGIPEYLADAEDVLKAAKSHMALYPPGVCYHLLALQRYYDTQSATLIFSLNHEEEKKEELSKLVYARYIPHKAVIWRRESDEELRDLVPLSRNKPPLNSKTTLYVCYRDRCEEPISDFEKIEKRLSELH